MITIGCRWIEDQVNFDNSLRITMELFDGSFRAKESITIPMEGTPRIAAAEVIAAAKERLRDGSHKWYNEKRLEWDNRDTIAIGHNAQAAGAIEVNTDARHAWAQWTDGTTATNPIAANATGYATNATAVGRDTIVMDDPTDRIVRAG